MVQLRPGRHAGAQPLGRARCILHLLCAAVQQLLSRGCARLARQLRGSLLLLLTPQLRPFDQAGSGTQHQQRVGATGRRMLAGC